MSHYYQTTPQIHGQKRYLQLIISSKYILTQREEKSFIPEVMSSEAHLLQTQWSTSADPSSIMNIGRMILAWKVYCVTSRIITRPNRNVLGWGYTSVMPYFKKFENNIDLPNKPAVHGYKGPVHVTICKYTLGEFIGEILRNLHEVTRVNCNTCNFLKWKSPYTTHSYLCFCSQEARSYWSWWRLDSSCFEAWLAQDWRL